MYSIVMGLGKKIVKALLTPINKIIQGLKNFFVGFLGNIFKSFGKMIVKFFSTALSTSLKFLTRMLGKITDGIMAFVNMIMVVVNTIKNLVLDIVDKVVGVAMTVFFYLKCTLKILSNFHKCAIFYLLDVIKYCILFLPLLIVQLAGSDVKGIRRTLDKVDAILGWPNEIRNDCYRCRNDGGKNNYDFWKKLQKALKSKDVGFSFVFIVMITLVALFFGYTIYVQTNTNNVM